MTLNTHIEDEMENEVRPLIMVTNDDGIRASGIKALAFVAERYADVVVVAPDGSYSGKSHSFTVMDELRTRKAMGFGHIEAYAVKGTPVDCVKLGVYGLVPRTPDLVLSGINHGSNTSISVHYSGTMGAAREAALIGIPSIAFSLANYSEDADFEEAQKVVDAVLSKFFDGQLPQAETYNVNIPYGKVNGVRLARMAMGRWIERPIKQTSPFGQDIYWLDGHFEDDEPEAADTDEAMVARGYAAMTPLLLDVTDYGTLEHANDFSINF